jgi:hypothetical protein
MGTKTTPSAFDCYAKAAPDEPMFILLARDSAAPMLVRTWAEIREGQIKRGVKPESDRAMVEEARECAQRMEDWRKK